MTTELARTSPARALSTDGGGFILPAVIADQGDKAAERFFTFFTDTISNPNTRAAYDWTNRFRHWVPIPPTTLARTGYLRQALQSWFRRE